MGGSKGKKRRCGAATGQEEDVRPPIGRREVSRAPARRMWRCGSRRGGCGGAGTGEEAPAARNRPGQSELRRRPRSARWQQSREAKRAVWDRQSFLSRISKQGRGDDDRSRVGLLEMRLLGLGMGLWAEVVQPFFLFSTNLGFYVTVMYDSQKKKCNCDVFQKKCNCDVILSDCFMCAKTFLNEI